jgi:type IV pilus assembly protein PilA
MLAARLPINGPMRAREDGFTLVELLIVVLICGMLAALAIPSFISQTSKATDAKAKTNLVSAQQAMETYFTDHNTYATANMNSASDPHSLVAIEASLDEAPKPFISSQTSDSYTLRVLVDKSLSIEFRLRHRSNGQVVRTCSPLSRGGCNSSGTW